MKVVLVRCPQPLVIGEESDALYSPCRAYSPEPTLPQVHGIIRAYAERTGDEIEVTQVDLRDPRWGHAVHHQYGDLTLPYIPEKLAKTFEGVDLSSPSVMASLESADIIGVSNNFAMSRGVVRRHIAEIRRLFPDKKIWIGGRDVFAPRVIDVYVQAAGRKNATVFHSHVFHSLPTYLEWKNRGTGSPVGVTIYSEDGDVFDAASQPLGGPNECVEMPLPVYEHPEALGYFTGSGEGMADPPFGRFVHATFSIGCPFTCGYCTTGYREKTLVHKGLQTIEDEMTMCREMGVTHLAIMDDNFLALGVERVKAIMQIVNRHGFKVEYGNGLQLRPLTDRWDDFAEPVLSNCVSLYCPLEDLTGDPDNQSDDDVMYRKLDTMNTQLGLMERIAREHPAALRYVTMGVVHGVPGHAKEGITKHFPRNVRRFLEVFRGSGLEVAVTVFNFITLPGTKFGEEALDSGRMVVSDPITKDPEVSSFGTVSYAPEGMTHTEVWQAYEDALNLNPAGKSLGVRYVDLQRFGERAVPAERRHEVPAAWRKPGYHLRALVE